MELELRRLEDLAESIVNDFAYMRAREEEMRDTNGKTSSHTTFTCHSPSLFPNRVHQLSSTLFWSIFNALSVLPGCVADILSQEILSSKETD